MQVNVGDANYTRQVEAVLAGKDFYSFVTQTQEDKSLILREVREGGEGGEGGREGGIEFCASCHSCSSCLLVISSVLK